MLKRMWNNYAEQYPYRWQWWISGFIYGIFFGKLYAEIKQTHETWNAITFEQLTWWDAARLTSHLKWFNLDEDEVTIWLLEQGYTFPITTDSRHTAFCSTAQCYCPDKSTRPFGDQDFIPSGDENCGPHEECRDDPHTGETLYCPNHYDKIMKDA